MTETGTSSKRDPKANVVQTVDRLLRERLSPFGFTDFEITPGEDHDGDPVLFIDAHYELSNQPVEPSVTLRTQIELRNRLLALGEERFPHLRHHFAEQQKVAGFR